MNLPQVAYKIVRPNKNRDIPETPAEIAPSKRGFFRHIVFPLVLSIELHVLAIAAVVVAYHVEESFTRPASENVPHVSDIRVLKESSSSIEEEIDAEQSSSEQISKVEADANPVQAESSSVLQSSSPDNYATSSAGDASSAPNTVIVTQAPHIGVKQYKNIVIEKIKIAKQYPASAIRRHLRGNVTLRVTVARSGAIISTKVIYPSIFEEFNQASTDAVIKAANLPPFPPEIAANRLDIQFLMNFVPE